MLFTPEELEAMTSEKQKRAIRNAAYHEANREKVNAYQRAYYQANRAKKRAASGGANSGSGKEKT